MDSRVILLPHPGGERLPKPGSVRVKWPSNNKHARKFLRAKGKWSLSTGTSGSSWLEFWGEYEGPTACDWLPSRDTRGAPRVVHSIDPRPGPPTLNTDPWVFHPGFVWSICLHKQLKTYKAEVRTGDIVLFGSVVRSEWVLDTVLVVDSRTEGVRGKIDDTYDQLVLPTIRRRFRPFVGRPYEDSGGPFSFAPAVRADDAHRPFQRPAIGHLFSSLRKIRNNQPPSPRNAQALVFCKRDGGAESFWKELVREIEKRGLVLGTTFHHPSSLDDLPNGQSGSMSCSEPTECHSTQQCS